MATLTEFQLTDRKILNITQSEFPLVAAPFAQIGDRIEVPEREVITRIDDLKRRNVIRQISAIFDTRRLGYKTTLVAMRFRDQDLDAAAQHINQHPGVSHNYGRTGRFNLWFTIAVPPGESLEGTIEHLGQETGAESWRILPTIRFFKIGVNFDMLKGKSDASHYFVPDDATSGPRNVPDADWNRAQPVSDRDIEVIRELQEDLPLEPRPFDPMAKRLGMTTDELFDYAADMVKRKIMRRYSAVLYHRRAGFAANAMVVWKVSAERSQEVGQIMAQSPHVTHCYERPTYDDWPYSHYTMIHAATQDECEAIAEEIANSTGIQERQLVYSTREYKKTRVRYFV